MSRGKKFIVHHKFLSGSESKGSVVFITKQAFSLINFRGPLIQELVRQGYEVHGLAPDFNAKTETSFARLGGKPKKISISGTGLNPLFDLISIISIYRQLRQIKPTYIIAYFVKPVIWGTLAAALARVPHRIAFIEGLGFVFTPWLSSDDDIKGGNEKFTKGLRVKLIFSNYLSKLKRQLIKSLVINLYKISLKFCHRVVFLNDDDQAEFLRLKIARPQQCYLLGPIGLDFKAWRPVIEKAQKRLRPIKLNKNLTFIFLGRILREKGVIEYLEAAKLVKTHHPSVRFLVVGGMDQNPGALCIDEVLDYVTQGVIDWPEKGMVEKVEDYLLESDCLVLPSYREGFPRSIQEAMVLGLTVIATDVPGCRQAVQEGKTGLLVAPYSAAAIAQAMTRLIQNPDFALTLARNAQAYAFTNFDGEKIAQDFIWKVFKKPKLTTKIEASSLSFQDKISR